jgi:NAD(P)-dependent dehydrogenase (short-subunit alcohol dehydrogenase family)
MLPLLRDAQAGRIVNVSSRVGSLSAITSPDFPFPGAGGVAYGPSKTALNAVTVAFAQELAATRIKVNAACPGYTATDLNGHSGTRTVEQGARTPVRLALLGDDGPSGTFSNDDGPIPW